MARKKIISMNCLSKSSIQNAIKQLRDYQNSLTYKCQMVAQKLAEKGVEIARVQIADLDAVFTSELISSIHSEYEGSTKGGGVWAVVAGTDHAMFVEFGTGIVGQEHPYPGEFPDGVTWDYASGKTIRQAMQDISINGDTFVKAGEYYWTYIGDDGKLHITKGMPSRPFMYYTSLQLIKLVEKTVKEVFKNG